jgi:phosphatidylglycerol:prolipoprotein diacylglycerol transferase
VIPTLFHIGPLEIHSYGLMLAVAFIVGMQVALSEAGQRKLDEGRLSALCLWIMVLAIAGSRLLYVASHHESYAGRWGDAFKLWEGGLTMYGGFLAALGGSLLYLRRHRMPVLTVCDAFSPAIALGSGITRLGCFLNGCCFGRPCHLPWAITFDPDSFAGTTYPGVPLHPTQLYLALAGFASFALLWSLRRRLTRPGQLFFLFLLIESTSRFVIDFFRHYEPGGESIRVLGAQLSLTQVLCLGLAALAIGGLAGRSARRAPAAGTGG